MLGIHHDYESEKIGHMKFRYNVTSTNFM